MQNSKDLTLTLEGCRIRRTVVAGSWEFPWLISYYTKDQCWPQKPNGTVKNSFRKKLDLKSHFFRGKKNQDFVLKNTHERHIFGVGGVRGREDGLVKKFKKSLQLKMMFSVQNALVCLVGAVIQASCMLGYLSPGEEGFFDRLLPLTTAMALHPSWLTKRTRGMKKNPAE